MTWFKLDDQFHSHPKVIAAGNAAVGLYCRLGTYCADKLTDGFIPDAVAKSMGAPRELRALTACPIPATRPLLTTVPGGYRLADYLDYNPTREQVLAERAKARDRMDRIRTGRKSSGEQQANNSTNTARSSPSPDPVPPAVSTQESSSVPYLSVVPDDDDGYIRALGLVVDAKVTHYRPRDPKAYRATVIRNMPAEDLELLRRLCAESTPEQAAAFVLGHGFETQADQAKGVPWCDDSCPTCGPGGVAGWVWVDDNLGGYEACPNRKAAI